MQTLEDKLTLSKWGIYGTYFGYPQCCIKAFKERNLPENSPLDGTGYRPCKECVKKYSKQELINNINKNRLCSTPFPVDNGKSFSEVMQDIRKLFSEE